MTEPRTAAERPALARLLAVDPGDFAERHWGRQPLLSTVEARGGDDFGDLFGLDAVDELVAHRGLRTPFLRVARDGTTLAETAFTQGGGIGAGVGDQVSDDKVLRLFADGATVVLQGLHRTWRPVVGLSQQLAADLGHPVQVNAYVTPPQSQGFSDHYDVHDVFVLQVHGEKRWRVHEPVLPSPLRDQPWAERRDEVEAAAAEPAMLEEVLRPGDCLYLPRGYIHAATALGGVSAHLTVGVHQWTRHHLVEQLVRAATAHLAGEEDTRRSLPLGVDVADPGSLADGDVDVARQALLEAIARVDAAELAAALGGQARAAQRPAPVPPLAQLAAAEGLTLASCLRLRPHLMAEVTGTATGEVRVRSRAGRVTVPAAHAHALQVLLRGQPVRVDDLDQQSASALEAARLLVRAGLAVPS